MDWQHARERFEFLESAYEADDGFRPRVRWSLTTKTDETGRVVFTQRIPELMGPSQLVRYPRESEQKFAARNAVAVYENHLAHQVGRYVSFLGRRKPQRDRVDAPLVQLMLQNCDLKGNNLDSFFRAFAEQAKARGSMLLVMDKPTDSPAPTLADQVRRRAVPYIRRAEPEDVVSFRLDDESGLFLSITLADEMEIDGKMVDIERDYTTTGWAIRRGKDVIAQGDHAFGQCPVLAFTESGDDFPVFGRYAQIADLSRRIFNAQSELDELIRGQTFSLLHLQVPPEESATFDAEKVAATIGTHSMLIHGGDAPGYISPDAAQAGVIQARIESLEASIRRIAHDESIEKSPLQESGIARRLRFEALNADLCAFAFNMQQLEQRMWTMFHAALGTTNNVQVAWPTDYNLADVMAELDILTGMQTTGFPQRVIVEKQRAVCAVEFDNADDATKAAIAAALDEAAQADVPPPTPNPQGQQTP